MKQRQNGFSCSLILFGSHRLLSCIRDRGLWSLARHASCTTSHLEMLACKAWCAAQSPAFKSTYRVDSDVEGWRWG